MALRVPSVKALLVVVAIVVAYVVLVMLSDAQDPYGTPDEEAAGT